MPKKVWITLATEFFLFAILLFGSAGTLNWAAGWVFMILFFGCASVLVLRLAQRDPALLEERKKMGMQPGQPLWDKILLSSLIIPWFGLLVLMGLDAARFHWSRLPDWLQWIGGAGMLISFWIFDRTFKENTFATPVVRIQKERELPAHSFCLVGQFLDCSPSVAPVLMLEKKVHANKPREIYWFLG